MTRELEFTGGTCRCEYPGEHLYEVGTTTTEYLQVGDTLVFPPSHPACVDLWFVCPEVSFAGTPWAYECPSEETDGERKLVSVNRVVESPSSQRKLNRERENGRAYYSKAAVNENPYPEEFHHLVDEDGPKNQYFAKLPGDNAFCLNGGTTIRSGEIPIGECASRVLNFNKAGDRRPLPGGTAVGNEWFLNLGIKTFASSDGSSEGKFHPFILDSETYLEDSPSEGSAFTDYLKQLGLRENVGNVLVPMHREGMVQSMAEGDYGSLHFDFYEKTFLKDITIANANDLSRLFVTQTNGQRTIFQLSSEGFGGIQTLELNMENVVKVSMVPKTFAAVVNMDICVVRYND